MGADKQDLFSLDLTLEIILSSITDQMTRSFHSINSIHLIKFVLYFTFQWIHSNFYF